jgi:hypothetical protein
MLSKTRIVLAAAFVLGVASMAQAAGDVDQTDRYLWGQSFDSGVNPVYHPSLSGQSGSRAFDFIDLKQQSRPRKKTTTR